MTITPHQAAAFPEPLLSGGLMVAPTIGPDLQLLISCARVELTLLQREHLHELCNQITNWPALIDLADRNLILPLVYRHLRSLTAEAVPVPVFSAMRGLCQQRVLRLMSMVAEQQCLVQQIFHPLNISYALVKGSSLAQRYYGELGLRQWRDIDVLVSPTRMFDIVQAMVNLGYRTQPEILLARELKFACQHPAGETKLISPRGTVIELHPWLDRKGCIFPTQKLLAQTEALDISGVTCQVLPTTALFVYICYHHSRHQWAKLHWLTDLDAFQRHPSFDLSAIQAMASRLGLTSTVEAAISLHKAFSFSDPQAVFLPYKYERTMRDACLMSIVKGEKIDTRKRLGVDFSFTWQVKIRYLCALTVAYLRPTYSDYKAWPLPPMLHPLYYLVRPIRMLGIVLSRWGQGKLNGTSSEL